MTAGRFHFSVGFLALTFLVSVIGGGLRANDATDIVTETDVTPNLNFIPPNSQPSAPNPQSDLRSAVLVDKLLGGESLSESEWLQVRGVVEATASGSAQANDSISRSFALSDDRSPTYFAVGVATGSLLLIAGLLLGLWLGRRGQVTASPVQDTERTLKMLADAFQFTQGFAGDVSECRQFVDRIGKIAAAGGDANSSSDLPTDPTTEKLLRQVFNENKHLQSRLNTAEEALKIQAESLSSYLEEARTDALTRLPNRRAFDDELDRRIAEWRRFGKAVAVLLVDVDHFKSFNDRFGHQAGDAVLTGVARTIREVTRQTDIVARYGGEEFVVVLSMANVREATQAAERARQAVEQAVFKFEKQTLQVTASCGVAHSITGDTVTSLVKRADVALYASKGAGRNASYWHDGLRCQRITLGVAPALKQHSETKLPTSLQIPPESQQVVAALRQRLLEVLDG